MTAKNKVFYIVQLYIVAAQLLFAGAIGFETPIGYGTYPVMAILTIVPLYALATKKSLRTLPLWVRLVDIIAIALVIAYAGMLALYAILFRNFTF
jgi:hypothetical protein